MSTTLTRSESAPLLLHRRSRRKSSVSVASLSCQDLPHSLDALDLSLPSPIETLASLRIVLLSYLSHLEISLSELDCTLADLEHGLDDARQWARDGLDMLGEIRADVVSRLPDLALDHPPAIDQLVARLHELRDVAAHLPLLPGLDGVKARLSDFDIPHPADYIPSLSARLQSLHAHISELELELPWSFTPFHSFHPTQFLSDLCDRLAALDLLHAPVVEKTEEKISSAAREVAQAIQLSLQGSRLIAYENLPEEWRNNPFVTTGYRFIPLNRWHLLALSVFAFHNETLNIHTHLIPFLLWARSLLPSPTSLAPSPADTPLYIFTFFALLCLGTSALWHTMSGCAHRNGMVLSAKLDYVGIGWLISASVASVVWHGFVGVPSMQRFYVGACVVTGVAGSVLPFYDWFNTPRHKMTRVAFFVSLSLTALAPLTHLAILSSPSAVLELTTPIAPSLASYVAGLFFYVSNLPERALSPKWAEWVFWCGGGSHAIWHAFIVLAIRQHRVALGVLRDARPILEGVVGV